MQNLGQTLKKNVFLKLKFNWVTYNLSEKTKINLKNNLSFKKSAY